MKRIHILLSGKVQGVGFRYFCQYQATLKSVTGTVKNLDNGDVELEVQGTEINLEKFLNTILKGNGFSKVLNFKTNSISLEENEKKFRITD